MNSKQSGRRRFLKNGAALAGLAVGAIQPVSGQSTGPEKKEAPSKDLHTYGERGWRIFMISGSGDAVLGIALDGCGLYLEPAIKRAGLYFYAERFK